MWGFWGVCGTVSCVGVAIDRSVIGIRLKLSFHVEVQATRHHKKWDLRAGRCFFFSHGLLVLCQCSEDVHVLVSFGQLHGKLTLELFSRDFFVSCTHDCFGIMCATIIGWSVQLQDMS